VDAVKDNEPHRYPPTQPVATENARFQAYAVLYSGLHSSGMLCSISGQPISPIFKGLAVQKRCCGTSFSLHAICMTMTNTPLCYVLLLQAR